MIPSAFLGTTVQGFKSKQVFASKICTRKSQEIWSVYLNIYVQKKTITKMKMGQKDPFRRSSIRECCPRRGYRMHFVSLIKLPCDIIK